MRIAVYPGSFDPITNGHIDIMERSARMFDTVVVAVVHNVYKKALFTAEERVEMIKEVTKHIPNIQVDSFSGLLIEYIRNSEACAIIRGLRTVSDFEYELQMAMMNRHLYPEVDTIFITCDAKYYYVSSTGVKEAALVGGSVEGLVPLAVAKALQSKLCDKTPE